MFFTMWMEACRIAAVGVFVETAKRILRKEMKGKGVEGNEDEKEAEYFIQKQDIMATASSILLKDLADINCDEKYQKEIREE